MNAFQYIQGKKGGFPAAVVNYSDFSLRSPSLSWELQVTNLSFWNFCFGVSAKHAAHHSATATELGSKGAVLFPFHPYYQACPQTLTNFLKTCRKQQLTSNSCYSYCDENVSIASTQLAETDPVLSYGGPKPAGINGNGWAL